MFTLSGPIHEWVAYRCRSSPATSALLAHHLDRVSRCGLADVARTCQGRERHRLGGGGWPGASISLNLLGVCGVT